MITTITGEQPFQVLTNNFSISPSNEGYTLQISADGKQYSNLFTVGAGVTRLVTGVAANSYYRLSGNQSKVSVNWMKTCVTEGGGSGTELQPVADFPLNAVEGTVISYTGSSSASGVYQYDGNEWREVGADDLSAYWTSAETQSAITAVEDHLFDVEQVTASALTELHDGLLEVSGRTVDMSDYWTSAQTEDAISAATSGKADAANVTPNDFMCFPKWNEQGVITGTTGNNLSRTGFYLNGTVRYLIKDLMSGDLGDLYGPTTPGTAGQILVSAGNGAPVWSAMSAADVTKAYVDSAVTELQDQIDTMDEVASAALVNLNNTKVESQDIRHMVKLTQSEYDDLSVKDPETFYIIVNSN